MSRKKAIDDKCKDCIYDPLAGGTWLKQVELCTVSGCPLYPYRPIPAASKIKNSSVSQANIDNLTKARAARGEK